MPLYFVFINVLDFYVLMNENVDVCIIEVNIGGEYDGSNCVRWVKISQNFTSNLFRFK